MKLVVNNTIVVVRIALIKIYLVFNVIVRYTSIPKTRGCRTLVKAYPLSLPMHSIALAVLDWR